MQALITEFAYGLSFFDRWQQRGVRTPTQLTAELRKVQPANARQSQDQARLF